MNEVEALLIELSDKLHFVMTTFRMKMAIKSSVVQSDGSPSETVQFEGSLLELYHMKAAASNEANLDEVEKEKGNGEPSD